MNSSVKMSLLAAAIVLTLGCDRAADSSPLAPMRLMVLRGKYDEAIDALENYVEKHPDGQDASRAGLFLFKANFAIQKYAEARKWCDWTIKNHPDSLEARKCEFKIGLIHIAQHDLPEALKQFEAVASSNRNPLRPEAVYFVDYVKTQIAADRQQPADGAEQE